MNPWQERWLLGKKIEAKKYQFNIFYFTPLSFISWGFHLIFKRIELIWEIEKWPKFQKSQKISDLSVTVLNLPHQFPGLSDAFLIGDSELHVYHTLNVKNPDVLSKTVVVFKAKPTCIRQQVRTWRNEYRVVKLNLTPEIEILYMLFDRSLSIFSMTLLKQHMEYFYFRC